MLKLLQRPLLNPGEWWDGYVARVLAVNGHVPNGAYLLGKLEPFVDAMVPGDVKRRAQAGTAVGVGLAAFSRHTLPMWAVRGPKSAAAYCPECYRVEPYVRLSWRLRAVTHCEIHGCPLRTKCGACGNSVFHWDLERASCLCGAPFTQASQSEMVRAEEPADDPAAHGREHWVFSDQRASNLLSVEDGCGDVNSEQIAVMAFLGCLLPSVAAVSVRGIAKSDRTVLGFLRRLALTALPSVAWVEQLWRSLPSTAHLGTAVHIVLKLHHEERTAPSDLSTLPLWEWAQALCSLGAPTSPAERKGWISAGELSKDLVSATTAARQAGLSVVHFQDLMKMGIVVPIRTFTLGVRQHQFTKEQVRKLQSLGQQGHRYGKPLDLGIEGNGLKVLERSGIANLVGGISGRTWLDRVELHSLLDDFNRFATPAERIDGQKVSLGSKRVWQSPYIPALKAMFSRLRSGELRLWAWGSAPGLARFYIGPDALEFLHRGALGRDSSAAGTLGQPELPLLGGEVAWLPTPQTWKRPPRLGWVQAVPQHAVQLPLQMA